MADYTVARVNKDKAAGLIGHGAETVWANGALGDKQNKTVATEGSIIAGPPNIGDVIVSSQTTVYAENKRIAIDGAVTGRGRHVGKGSPNVFAGNNAGYSGAYTFSVADVPNNAPTPAQLANSKSWNTVGDGGSALPPTDSPTVTDVTTVPQADSIKQFLDQILPDAKHWTRGSAPLGNGGNQNIVRLFSDLGADKWAQADSTPWCAAFVNWVLKQCGYYYTQDLGVASFYAKPSKWHGTVLYDRKTKGDGWKQAAAGDICVWDYPGKSSPTSHVNFVYANNGSLLQLCGGNQSGKSPNNNNPTGSSVTNTGRWSPAIDKPGAYSLMMIIRPQKRSL